MFSYLRAVLAWLAASASLLLDLAVAGRATNDIFTIAVVSIHAVLRIAAFLIFVLPGLGWLKNQIWVVTERRRKDEWVDETRIRVFLIILIILSVAFEIWVSPERKATPDEDNTPRIEAGDST